MWPREALLKSTTTRPAKINVGKSVGSFVPGLAQAAFEKYGFSTVALLTDWPAIAGQDLAHYTKPERLKWPRAVSARGEVEAGCQGRPGATLILRVEPCRALDVQYGTRQLVERINSYFGYRAVAEIRILQAPLDHPAKPRADAAAHASAATRVERSGHGEPLSGIANEKLRRSLELLQAGICGR